jgi:hypothetical protein
MFFLVACVDSALDEDVDKFPENYKQPSQKIEDKEKEDEKIDLENSSTNEDGISYSLNKGLKWIKVNDTLEKFDIWNIKKNEEVKGMVFFYATTFEELVDNVEKYKTTNFYSYNYLTDTSWDYIFGNYNEEYFENNILLFYYKLEPNISKNYVYNVVVKDNTLFLNINRFEGMSTALSSWFYLVTIKKEDVKDVTEYNVVVRTISELQKTVTVYPKAEYIRDIYMNGLSVDDFPGLDNLKSINVWTWGIMVDIHFNEKILEERLNEIVGILRESKNIRSVGYTSNTWIRVTINDKFYDKYKFGTLSLKDIFEKDIEEYDKFTMKTLNFTPIVIITLEMEKHGKSYYEAMRKQLGELKYEFLDLEESLR